MATNNHNLSHQDLKTTQKHHTTTIDILKSHSQNQLLQGSEPDGVNRKCSVSTTTSTQFEDATEVPHGSLMQLRIEEFQHENENENENENHWHLSPPSSFDLSPNKSGHVDDDRVNMEINMNANNSTHSFQSTASATSVSAASFNVNPSYVSTKNISKHLEYSKYFKYTFSIFLSFPFPFPFHSAFVFTLFFPMKLIKIMTMLYKVAIK